MRDLFPTPKAVALRLSLLFVAYLIVVGAVAVAALIPHAPYAPWLFLWTLLNGLMWGGLSQVIAGAILRRIVSFDAAR